jgi:uncharacterized membrane protein
MSDQTPSRDDWHGYGSDERASTGAESPAAENAAEESDPMPSDDRQPLGEMLQRMVVALEADPMLDRWADRLDRIRTSAPVAQAADRFDGSAIGHAAHPPMTDLPLACWTGAALLDLLGGRSSRTAARRLTALGVVSAVPTLASGLVEFGRIDDPALRRVAAVHATANSTATTMQLLSWGARRRGRTLRGVGLGLAANSVSGLAGYLGGHMAFARGVGTGSRLFDRVDAASPTKDEDPATTGRTSGWADAPMPVVDDDVLDADEAIRLMQG